MPRFFAIKAAMDHPDADAFQFVAQKTMYGGKTIAVGDRVFVFASENHGGAGLAARGVVTAAAGVQRTGDARQTPRVSVEIRRDRPAIRACGRGELRAYRDWGDGRPETELNFKLYRQATDKIVALTEPTGAWLDRFF